MIGLEVILVLMVLALAIYLFVSEKLRIDISAITIMLLVGWLGLIEPSQIFSGLASNAVVSIIAVMIMGYGIDKSGVMNRIINPIMSFSGSSEKKLIGIVSLTVGIISSFIQNIGSAALFLPSMIRISKSAKIPVSNLLMPMGFAAILGGTITMVGSSPLIILNDLLIQAGKEPYGLFDVTPLGIILLTSGIVYFLVFGRFVLPKNVYHESRKTFKKDLADAWLIPHNVFHCVITIGSPIIGLRRDETYLRNDYHLNLLAIIEDGDVLHTPPRNIRFTEGMELALLGSEKDFKIFIDTYGLKAVGCEDVSKCIEDDNYSGFAEVIIPPHSSVEGKSLKEIAIRRNLGVEPTLLYSDGIVHRVDFSKRPLQTGDVILVHGLIDNIRELDDKKRFVVLTPLKNKMEALPNPYVSVLCFLSAISLALIGFNLSLALFSGAVAMVLSKVITIDEAYKAVHWRTVFLLAGLIPLGLAMDQTGTAKILADSLIGIIGGYHPLLILLAIGLLSTLFSLFMSNVAATVLLAPLMIILGDSIGVDSRALVLLVGICASNSFIIPTHQVNALLMGPGGYKNKDYMKAGGLMSLLFLTITVLVLYFFYM